MTASGSNSTVCEVSKGLPHGTDPLDLLARLTATGIDSTGGEESSL
jgi:hypothetical protein